MTTVGLLSLAWPFAAFGQNTFPGWHQDLATAAERAAEAKKPIFAVFRCVR